VDEMIRPRIRHRGNKKCVKIFFAGDRQDHLEDIRADGRLTLKWSL